MTLLELLGKYNFRYCTEGLDLGHMYRQNSCIVRIYYDDMYTGDWFEIGVNDWDDNKDKIHRLKIFIKDEILNRQVYQFRYEEDINVLCIELMPVFVECPQNEGKEE